MGLLSKEAILGASDLKTEDVDVGEWGGSVRVRTMTGAERDSFGKSLMVDGKVDPTNYRVKLLARCIVGEDGAGLFSEADIGALNGKSNQALERVFAVADRLNSISEAAVEAQVKLIARPERRFILRWALVIGYTPRRLLAEVNSDDITEMMAYEQLEPWGPLADEFRIGQVAATIANVNRSSDASPVYSADDFMPALHRALHGEEEPDARGADLDPEALSALIDAQVFGRVH